MRYTYKDVVLLEVPDEISLSYTISGCSKRCDGCHSPELWNPKNGKELTVEEYQLDLENYKNYITCVLFMGGEWCPSELSQLLCIAKNNNLKTCLYSGEDDISKIPSCISDYLTYLKIGKYSKELGGLESESSNQLLIDLETMEIINEKIRKTVTEVVQWR